MIYIAYFYFSVLKGSKETSVSSTFVTLSSIVCDVKGEGCRQSSTRARSIDKYEGKGTFKVNEGDKDKLEGKTNFVTLYVTKISLSFFSLLKHFFFKLTMLKRMSAIILK